MTTHRFHTPWTTTTTNITAKTTITTNISATKTTTISSFQIHRQRTEGRLQKDPDRTKPGSVLQQARGFGPFRVFGQRKRKLGKEIRKFGQNGGTEQQKEERRGFRTRQTNQSGTQFQRKTENQNGASTRIVSHSHGRAPKNHESQVILC